MTLTWFSEPQAGVGFFYLCTSTEAPWVQEGKDVQGQDSGEPRGKINGLGGDSGLELLGTEFLLGQGAAFQQVHQDPPPLAICPLVKLKKKKKKKKKERVSGAEKPEIQLLKIKRGEGKVHKQQLLVTHPEGAERRGTNGEAT